MFTNLVRIQDQRGDVNMSNAVNDQFTRINGK
jgi:hypothetical protein